MWLSSSSVGRKFVMALTGAFLVLFVTFHCLMNSIAIVWPAAYNVICEFLGANWYALLASAVLAVFILIHIIYAVMLTLQNRKARGNDRYSISKRPAGVEWSSQNMFVLGVVILAFLVVHLIQFWAKMQWVEIIGSHGDIPPVAGTLFLQEAFSQVWTPIVYIIGFIALWFHMNHGFWSMFQSVGWDSTVWIPRLKKIACAWSSIVVLLFIAQAIVFTVKANENYYKTNEVLRTQYLSMIADQLENDFGSDGVQFAEQVRNSPYEQVNIGLRQMEQQISQQLEFYKTNPEAQAALKNQPGAEEQLKDFEKRQAGLKRAVAVFDYLSTDAEKEQAQKPMYPNM